MCIRDCAGSQGASGSPGADGRSEEHTSELQSLTNLVCRLLLEKKKREMGVMLIYYLRLEVALCDGIEIGLGRSVLCGLGVGWLLRAVPLSYESSGHD